MIDFRSDTVTRPSAGMRSAIAEAEVGDDVYGEDPTVNNLEEKTAALLGKEAAVFVSSGTQSNLLAILAQCQRGDEYLVGQQAHAYLFEAGGAAVLGGVQPQPLELDEHGMFDLKALDGAIKRQPSMHHLAHSKLLSIENTFDGKVLPHSYIEEVQQIGRDHNLALHLDGARMWNAAVSSGRTPGDVVDGFDTVSVCLSKGLGAPVGSVLVGDEQIIEEARRWRKMLGGGTRQAGILAAAGIYALDNNLARMSEDHDNSAHLAAALSSLPGVSVDGPHTNMLFVQFEGIDTTVLAEELAKQGILIFSGDSVRLVCHLDIEREDIDRAVTVMSDVLEKLSG